MSRFDVIFCHWKPLSYKGDLVSVAVISPIVEHLNAPESEGLPD
jgi:hypothetical protein